VLEGACADLGGAELPYAPIVAVLRTLARETKRDRLAELAGRGRDELALLLPELATSAGTQPAEDPLAREPPFRFPRLRDRGFR